MTQSYCWELSTWHSEVVDVELGSGSGDGMVGSGQSERNLATPTLLAEQSRFGKQDKRIPLKM